MTEKTNVERSYTMKPVSLALFVEDTKQARAKAKKLGISLSLVVRQLIKMWLNGEIEIRI